MYYKKSQKEKSINFYAPSFECFACNDTGLVNNSDGLINLYWGDYDKDENGKRFYGGDFAIICHCKKAYQITDDNGKVISGGFRDSQGNINTTNTINGEQAIGVSLTKDQTREIHTTRKNNWAETQKIMNEWRLKNLGKKKPELPYFIKTVKDQLKGVNDLFAMPKGVK